MYQSIMIDELEKRMKEDKVIILDVREEDEYKSGHIAGAQNNPLSQLQETIPMLNKKDHYYIICHSGGRSQMACQQLSSLGFKVTNVLGGMSAWQGMISSEIP